MRRTAEEKSRIHDRIVELASLRFQELGLDGISVSELMDEVGRTVGGFYRHFETREKLVEEALSRAFDKRNEAFARFVEPASDSTLKDLLDNYLSEEHADYTRCDCPAAAVMNDVARSSDSIRKIYTGQIEKELAALTAVVSGEQTSQKRSEALLVLCTLVGAIGLARAVDDRGLTRDILDVKHTLLKLLGDQ